MAGKKENLKSLFTNTRSRVILVFTATVLIFAVVFGLTKFFRSGSGLSVSSDIRNAPVSIGSIPGALDPTAQYAHLVESQNVNQAQSALKTGGSAIPTIIRSQALGSGAGTIGGQGGQGGLGFSGLAKEDEAGQQRLGWMDELQKNSCSKQIITKVTNEGASLSDIKQGCSCVQLKADGYNIDKLREVCSCKELKSSGFNARQLKDNGYTAGQLRLCGFDACELRNAGFTAQEMMDGGFSPDELKGAGYPEKEIASASGLPGGLTADDVKKANCQVDALKKLREAGVSAASIRRISGCSAAQLLAAGYTPAELRAAGFTAAELKKAGVTGDQLRQAGYSARDLLNAGFKPDELAAAGYKPGDLLTAEGELPPGITPEDVKAAGCDVDTLKKEGANGVSAKLIRQYAGCSVDQLKAAGFTQDQPQATDEADCSVSALTQARLAGVSATTIRETRGCSVSAMKAAGYSAKQLKDAGFTAAELKKAGFTPKDLKAAGFSAKDLRDAGFSAADLKKAGYSAGDLKAAGFTADELKKAGFTAGDLKAAGFTPDELKKAGFTASDLKAAGFTPDELKKAGFTASDLKAAGFTPDELKKAGFTASDLKNAGYSTDELAAAGIETSNVAGLTAVKPSDSGQSGVGMIPSLSGPKKVADINASNSAQLQQLMQRQNAQMADQKYQQKIQQRTSEMSAAANQALQGWKRTPTQVYMTGSPPKDKKQDALTMMGQGAAVKNQPLSSGDSTTAAPAKAAVIKTGDILFAVIDTSVNSDEPGPILATIVSGKLKGAKLIGSFTLPSTAEKMIITFNTMSVPGAPRSTSISAVAVDANTARTALSSNTDHHYMLRYGNLFASSFLEGLGSAIQSAGTTVTIGGTGGGDNTTVVQNAGYSVLENALVALGTVGQNWAQEAQKIFNTPITVQVYSGTAVGVLFTQDLTSI